MGAHGELIWLDEDVGRLRTLHAKGISASLIGAEMDRTRNAVLGKLWRLGLSNAASTIRKVKGVRPQKRPQKKKPYKPSPAERLRRIELQKTELRELRCAPVIPRAISFADLEDNECRYPDGEGPYTFCGHLQQAGSSYCANHEALAKRNHHRMSSEEYQQHRLRIVLAKRSKAAEAGIQISEAAE